MKRENGIQSPSSAITEAICSASSLGVRGGLG